MSVTHITPADPAMGSSIVPLPSEVTEAVGAADFGSFVDAIGHHLAEHGTRGVERQLATVAQIARRRGVAAVSSSVLCDRTAPEIVRARAFARVAAALVAVREPVATAAAA